MSATTRCLSCDARHDTAEAFLAHVRNGDCQRTPAIKCPCGLRWALAEACLAHLDSGTCVPVAA